jgi:signal peptidase I
MDTLHASPFELEDAAVMAGGDDGARALTAIERTRQALGFLRRHLFWVTVATLATIVLGGLAYLRTWPPMAIVQSGSMVPTINIGDVEILKHMDGPPKVGEIAVIHVPDAARTRFGYPPVVSHRIVKIARNGNVTTKGDALKTVDPFLTPRNTITEQVVGVIPQAGRVFGFFTSTWGELWLAVGVLLIVGLPVLDGRREREQQDRDSMASLQTQLETLTQELGSHHSGAATAPVGPLETELKALVEQATSAQLTLADATAALHDEHARLERERRATPATRAVLTTPPARAAAVADTAPAPSPGSRQHSLSWAVLGAAALVGCRLIGRRRD